MLAECSPMSHSNWMHCFLQEGRKIGMQFANKTKKSDRNRLRGGQFGHIFWHAMCLMDYDPLGSPSQLTLLVNSIFTLMKPIEPISVGYFFASNSLTSVRQDAIPTLNY